MTFTQRYLAIAASVLLSTVLGSIHAFSVFVPEWERLTGAGRGEVSLIYSTALVSLTLAVLAGYRVFGRFAPSLLVLIVGAIAAVGLLLSAYATSLLVLYLTYGVLFGAANGLGYGYVLQLAGQTLPTSRGLAMCLVTAFYAVGATLTPKFFAVLIGISGNALALKTMSMVVLLASVVAACLLKQSSIQFNSELKTASEPLTAVLVRIRAQIWLAYGCAVTAGLMVIGHSYGIAIWAKLNASTAVWAATLVALGNMLGGFSVGFFVDKLSSRYLLSWLPALSTIGLMILLWFPDKHFYAVFLALALIGYSYGAIIAVYPVAVADVFGAVASPRVYGQVFTAWGLAGLLGPWVSGWLFDITQSYSQALLLAVFLSCASIVVIRKRIT